MPLFVISWRDKPNAFETRAGAREAHLAFIETLGDKAKLGGPYLDDEGRMIGSMMVVEADDLAQIQALHARDPYKLAGLFETSTITPWRLTVQNFGGGS
ncbi:MAG TPA: YciI family protein [Caulobacteraceae bacterium]